MNPQSTNRTAFHFIASSTGGASAFFQLAHLFVASYTSSSTLFHMGSLNANHTTPFLTGLRLPISSSMVSQVNILLKRADYPGIRFWTRLEWMDYFKSKNSSDSSSYGTESVCGRTLMSQGVNKTAKYIEDASGNLVDRYKLKDILTHAFNMVKLSIT